jgi:hypothetical protein
VSYLHHKYINLGPNQHTNPRLPSWGTQTNLRSPEIGGTEDSAAQIPEAHVTGYRLNGNNYTVLIRAIDQGPGIRRLLSSRDWDSRYRGSMLMHAQQGCETGLLED